LAAPFKSVLLGGADATREKNLAATAPQTFFEGEEE
jgi:hypothetical protein